jgi:hypothetical protein
LPDFADHCKNQSQIPLCFASVNTSQWPIKLQTTHESKTSARMVVGCQFNALVALSAGKPNRRLGAIQSRSACGDVKRNPCTCQESIPSHPASSRHFTDNYPGLHFCISYN